MPIPSEHTQSPKNNEDFPLDKRNRVKRLPKRAHYDQQTIQAIFDEALICHVGFSDGEQPYVIPTIHGRQGETLYLHGALASRLLKHIAAGKPVCVTATLVDGIVFARSIFHHSMNYRSAVVFGKGRLVENSAEKLEALEVISEHIAKGRWKDARSPNDQELAATMVIAIEIESGSAKIRSGPPVDDEADLNLPVWAGVLPLAIATGEVIEDQDLAGSIVAPEYVKSYRRGDESDLRSDQSTLLTEEKSR